LFTTTNRYRLGHATSRDSFAAFAALDRAGDSLAFVPLPFNGFVRGDIRATPATLAAAVQRQRDILLGLARDWVKRYPRSADAHEALAYALESRGEIGSSQTGAGVSAIDALRSALAVSADTVQRFRLALAEVRVLVKRGQFEAARALADSMLAHTDPLPAKADRLAGLAALTGQAGLAARLIQLGADASPSGNNASLLGYRTPGQVRAPAASFVAHAALGACDSVRVQLPRVERAIEMYVEPNGRRAVWNSIVPAALSMAAPCDSARALLRADRPSDRLMLMQQALAHHDLNVIRQNFTQIRRGRESDRPGDVAIDYTFQEAWLLAAIGDTAAAVRHLEHALNALPTLGDYIVEFVPQSAALGRALALHHELTLSLDRKDANDSRQQLDALWRNADGAVRPSSSAK
jgi:tetratricopeptide (TPR) repeat protein